jgi:hypothetical protein
VGSVNSAKSLCGLVFEARAGDPTLRPVDFVEIDDSLDQIVSFTVLVRPLGGLMALSARVSGSR